MLRGASFCWLWRRDLLEWFFHDVASSCLMRSEVGEREKGLLWFVFGDEQEDQSI